MVELVADPPYPLSKDHTQENGCVCKVRAVRRGVYMSWSRSCFAMSRLFAVVAETAVPCFGSLLRLDLTNKCFKPNESCIDVPVPFSIFTPSSSKVFLWTEMLRICYNLMKYGSASWSRITWRDLITLFPMLPLFGAEFQSRIERRV